MNRTVGLVEGSRADGTYTLAIGTDEGGSMRSTLAAKARCGNLSGSSTVFVSYRRDATEGGPCFDPFS